MNGPISVYLHFLKVAKNKNVHILNKQKLFGDQIEHVLRKLKDLLCIHKRFDWINMASALFSKF